MAAPTFRAVGHASKTSASTELLAKLPAGTVEKDLWLMVVELVGSDVLAETPAGWTALPTADEKTGELRSVALFWRLAPASPTAPTLKYASSTKAYASIYAVTQGTFNEGSPFNVKSASWKAEETPEPNVSGVPTTVNECLLLAWINAPTAMTAAPTGWTEVDNLAFSGSTYRMEQATAGGTSTAPAKKGNAKLSWAFTVAVAPVASGKKTQEEAVAVRAGSVAALVTSKVAQAAVATRAGTQAAVTAVKVAAGVLSARGGAIIAVSAVKVAVSPVSVTAGARTVFISSGQKIAEQAVATVAGARVSVQAVRVATGAVQARSGTRTAIVATRAAQTTVRVTAGTRTAIAAQLVASTPVTVAAGAMITVGARVSIAGFVAVRAGARITITTPTRSAPPGFGRPITGYAQGASVGRDTTGYAHAGSAAGPTTGEAAPTREERP